MKDHHVNDQVKFLTDCVINVFNNFVLQKTIICKDKDPPWMKNEIKCACLKKANIYRRYVKNIYSIINQHDLQNAVTFNTNLISEARNRYICSFGKNINDPQLGVKGYWSIVNL